MAFHTRSVSLPTKSHSSVLKAEAELHKLKACVGSSSLSFEIILDALKGINNTYECINDLLCMTTNQNSFSHPQQRRQLDQELEESIKFLDVYSTSRDNVGEIKYNIQDLESAERRCASDAIRSKTKDYVQLVKKSSKNIKKHACRKSESMEGDFSVVLGLLNDTREIIFLMIQSLFSLLSNQIVEQKTGKWSLKRRVSCKEDTFDIVFLRVNVEKLENELESLFRHMIQCRVSLLNISSS
ncbi:hypothetical protein LUZ60_011954 [Juncus effusus]|nr:hypothetical protein LUZ60_011954 [Juncus effusus]